MEQCPIGKLARSDEPKVNQVQMKSKAKESGKYSVVDSLARGEHFSIRPFELRLIPLEREILKFGVKNSG